MVCPVLPALVLSLAAAGGVGGRAPSADPEPGAGAPDFNREVRPILADRCFRCHGPDEHARKQGLRLDTQGGSRATLSDGLRAVVPRDTAASELVRRIMAEDPDEVMPPPELNKPLSREQKDTLARWIESGAEYAPHWSFVPPRPASVDGTKTGARDAIDALVRSRLEREGLTPAPDADRATLLRRVCMVLTGLPPSPEEIAAFVADPSADAYEKQVDRLLASEHFGERMAADWLDVARFADTFGYQSDWECRVWPWRDWLIGAFNANMRYDEFVREQIAGDLIPGATREQKLATAFNRLHRQTNEGGSIDEEFRQEYVSDRVHTFGSAFLGLTVECARCHDHKYDPISQRDYYSLCAFFGAIDESGSYPYSTPAVPRPAMRLPTPEQEVKLAALRIEVEKAESASQAVLKSREGAYRSWLATSDMHEVIAPVKRFPLAGSIDAPPGKGTLLDGDSGPSFGDVPPFRRCDPFSLVLWIRTPDRKDRATVLHTSTFTIESDQQGYQLMLKDGRLCWEIVHFWPGSAAAIRTRDEIAVGSWAHVAVTYDGSSRAAGMHLYLNGQPAETEVVRDHLDGPATVHSFQVGFRDRDVGFKGGGVADVFVFDRELAPPEVDDLFRPGALGSRINTAREGKSSGAPVNDELLAMFARAIDPDCMKALRMLRDARAAEQDALEPIPEVMVMEASPHAREGFVLSRGRYDQPDRSMPVAADRAIEGVLPFDTSWPHDRLGLARWTTDPRNPLTARVAVNRLWSLCFGRGLAPTLENLGTQGEMPLYQDVLDALAADFVAGGWNIKATLRRVVLSGTFRQSSDFTSEKLAKDPQNALLSRGPSFRLSAEMLRDQALAASGLLAAKIGGPSVKPWQPAGIWEDAGASIQRGYVPDTGENAHRRSLYTFRKRTAPPPDMLAFDAGSRELCLARRLPTNTPLQPLVLMNDPVFFECARALASRVAGHDAADVNAQVALAFVSLTGRPAREAEARALRALFDRLLGDYTSDRAAARAALGGASEDPALAAMTLVCSTIMASDAAVTLR